MSADSESGRDTANHAEGKPADNPSKEQLHVIGVAYDDRAQEIGPPCQRCNQTGAEPAPQPSSVPVEDGETWTNAVVTITVEDERGGLRDAICMQVEGLSTIGFADNATVYVDRDSVLEAIHDAQIEDAEPAPVVPEGSESDDEEPLFFDGAAPEAQPDSSGDKRPETLADGRDYLADVREVLADAYHPQGVRLWLSETPRELSDTHEQLIAAGHGGSVLVWAERTVGRTLDEIRASSPVSGRDEPEEAKEQTGPYALNPFEFVAGLAEYIVVVQGAADGPRKPDELATVHVAYIKDDVLALLDALASGQETSR